MNVGNIGNELSPYSCMRSKHISKYNKYLYHNQTHALNTISDLKSLISLQIMKKSPFNEYSDTSVTLDKPHNRVNDTKCHIQCSAITSFHVSHVSV